MRLGSNKRTECVTCHVPSMREPRRACPDCRTPVCAACRRKRICCTVPHEQWPWIVEHRKRYPKEEEPVTAPPIPIADWGRDHWSTFAYIETRIVDHKGVPQREHMRCNNKIHGQFGHRGGCSSLYPTKLREGEATDHDDWSCLDDAEAAGLLENISTGLHPVYKLTERGFAVAGQLRRHKAGDGNFSTFVPKL